MEVGHGNRHCVITKLIQGRRPVDDTGASVDGHAGRRKIQRPGLSVAQVRVRGIHVVAIELHPQWR